MSTILNAEWLQWVKVVGLLVVFALFVFAAWWALYADRARGRRRCPKCWYDMAYSPGMTCPECGHTAHAEGEFKKTRQRRGLAIASFLGATLVGLYVANTVMARGWMSYVPTRAVIWMMPMADDPNGSVMGALDRRMRNGSLSEEHWLAVLERIVIGDGDARPPGDEWIAKYGGLLDGWRRRFLTGGDAESRRRARDLILTLPPRVDLTTRPSWPAGVPPTADVAARDWWPGRMHLRITARPDAPGARTDTHIRTRNAIQRRSYSIFLPALEPGSHAIDVEFTYQQRSSTGAEWKDVGRQVVTVPFTVEGEMEEMLTAVNEEGMAEAIRRCFDDGLVKHPGGNLPVRVGVSPQETYTALFEDTAVGVRIDVLRNGRLGRRLDIWWKGGTNVSRSERQHAWEVPYWDDEVLGAPSQPDDEWTLRVRSMPELALRVQRVSRYWEGEVTVPVPARDNRQPAPSRGFVPEAGPAPIEADEVR